MFGIGLTEMIVVGVIALIFIGPDQLPQVARTVGKFINDLRRSSDEIKSQFREHTNFEDLKNPPPPSVTHHPAEPEEFKPPPPHKGDNLAEMFPELYGEKKDEQGEPVKKEDEDKKKG